MKYSKPRITRATHVCGVCKVPVLSARWRDTGVLVHVERITERGRPGKRLDVVAELPGTRAEGDLPHVALASKGIFVEHVCS